MVLVDDAHPLDDLSALVLHQLVHSRAAPVILTLRTGASAPAAVTALWKDGLLRRCELEPLHRNEIDTLLVATLGAVPDRHCADRLWRSWRLVDDVLKTARGARRQQLLVFRANQLALAARPVEVLATMAEVNYDDIDYYGAAGTGGILGVAGRLSAPPEHSTRKNMDLTGQSAVSNPSFRRKSPYPDTRDQFE
ncbi:hypothetical protein A5661_16625 [Mycobacterium asiaticum]|nr:hypothetical protein A5661_16625 [Mycobacterium asiaticum]